MEELRSRKPIRCKGHGKCGANQDQKVTVDGQKMWEI